jgi:ribosomal protein S18 acetylase RimI-like enzyme
MKHAEPDLTRHGDGGCSPTDAAPPRVATAADVPALSAALAAAFVDDPVFSWLIPARGRRRARLRRFFELELRYVVLPKGRLWCSARSSGASLELAPGAWRMPLTTQLVHGPGFTRVFGARLPHALTLITLMDQRHISEPHYYIAYVGVAPEAQGHGFGTRLLQPTLDRCDREGLPAYLEATSARNRALYERLGFEVQGELRVGGSPPLWPMRRPPTRP